MRFFYWLNGLLYAGIRDPQGASLQINGLTIENWARNFPNYIVRDLLDASFHEISATTARSLGWPS